MAFVQMPGEGLWIPKPLTYTAYSSLLLDTAGTRLVAPCVFDVPLTGTLDGFAFRLGTVTQAPVNGLHCSFQDVSGANGDPDGTPDQFRVVTAGLTSNAWVETGLVTSDGTDTGTKRSVTAGQRLAAVIGFESFVAGDSLNISALTTTATNVEALGRCFPDLFTTAWAKQASAPIFALKYAGVGYVPVIGVYPFSALNASSYATGSTPDERGNVFSFPFGVQVSGGWAYVNPVAAGRDFSGILYDSDGATPLAAVVSDVDMHQTTSALRVAYFPFAAPITLLANTAYRWVIRPDTVSNITVQDVDVPTAAHMAALTWGTSCTHVERADAGAWTNTTTKRTFCGLVVSAIDIPSAGGPLGHSMRGGFVNG